MKNCSLGSVISILGFITMNLMEMNYGRSAFSSARPDSNLSNLNTKDHTGIRLGKFHKRSIKNDSEAFERLEAIRADHYKRKVAFLEKELEICFSQIEKYHRKTVEERDNFTSVASTSRAADSFVSTPPTSLGLSSIRWSANTADSFVSTRPNGHESSKVRKNTEAADLWVRTTPNSQGSSKNVQLTEAESVILDELKDHNNVTNLTIFWRKEKELSQKQTHFLTHEYTQWDGSVNFDHILPSYKVGAIESMEEFYKSYLPKVIMYDEVADKMQASFGEDEIGHAHLLLCVMEELNLIQRRNGSSTEKMISPMPVDKLKEIITPRIVRWVLFLLFGQHPSLPTLRSRVESEPHLTLYEFCWCISKTWDMGTLTESEDPYDSKMGCSWMGKMIGEFVAERGTEHYERRGSVLSPGPLLRSMNILLTKCNEVFDEIQRND